MGLRDWAREARVVLRGLARRPGYTAAAVLTLALGVGANVALFSLVHAVLLRPLPFPDADALVRVEEADFWRPSRNPSPANFLDLRRMAESFASVSGHDLRVANLEDDAAAPARVTYADVSSDFFRTLQVEAALGRTFVPESGREREAVLAHAFWRERFGGDPAALGAAVRLDGTAYRIVGVTPRGFDLPGGASLWTAAQDDVPGSPFVRGDRTQVRDSWYHDVVARLAPGVGIAAAAAEMEALAARLEEAHPDDNRGLRIRLVPLREELVGPLRGVLLLLLGATGLVLLAASANVANLLLVRALQRRGELAVRRALGAGRLGVALPVLGEAVALAVLGSLAGLALAGASLAAVHRAAPDLLPGGAPPTLDGAVLAYAGGLSLLTLLLFGLAPAAWAARGGGAGIGAVRGRGAPTGRRLQSGLVAVETAAAVVLTLGAALLLRSVAEIRAVDPGFEAEATTFVSVGLPGARRMGAEERVAFYREAQARVASLPGVEAAAWSQVGPLSAGPGAGLRVRGGDGRVSDEEPLSVRWQAVSPGYFRAVGTAVRAGRPLLPSDGAEGEAVAVVNETFARLVFGEADPVGRLINTGLDGREGDGWRWVRVVGVVADTRNRGVTRPPDPAYFRPLAQGGPGFGGDAMVLALRGGDPGLPALQEAVWAVNASAPLYGYRTGEALVAEAGGGERALLLVLGAFAALAVVLGMVGIGGVTAFTVRRRTRELGVRMALGADGGEVVGAVVRGGLVPVGAGLAAGTAAAAVLGRLLERFLFGVTPLDPLAFGVVPPLLLATATLALLLPARRAARIDPVVALRAE